MSIPKIYVETSVFNAAIDNRLSKRKVDTLKFFEEVRCEKYEPFTSDYVTNELNNAQEDRRVEMKGLMDEYGMEVLSEGAETECLAETYVKEGIIPKKYRADALHIASATVNGLDAIISWNFKHIVRKKTVAMTAEVNERNGYKKVRICSPSEVTVDDVL